MAWVVRGIVLLVALSVVRPGGAQDSTATPGEHCLRNTGILLGAGLAGTMVLLDQAWYADYDRAPFHVFDDSREWLQMDKGGHLFNTYQLGRVGHALVERCGTTRKQAIWIGGSIGWVFLAGIEVLDGTSAEWGFSWSDMAANTIGAGLFIGQELLWDDQRLQLKISSHPTEYAALRPDVLGRGFAEEVLKDYNGHTFWLSGNLHAFLPRAGLPKWLNLAAGLGAEAMITAHGPPGGDGRYRQFYLAPDVDLTRIPTRSKALRTVLFLLNGLKVPLPALEVGQGGRLSGHWLYF